MKNKWTLSFLLSRFFADNTCSSHAKEKSLNSSLLLSLAMQVIVNMFHSSTQKKKITVFYIKYKCQDQMLDFFSSSSMIMGKIICP